jgi:hypothetical protein
MILSSKHNHQQLGQKNGGWLDWKMHTWLNFSVTEGLGKKEKTKDNAWSKYTMPMYTDTLIHIFQNFTWKIVLFEKVVQAINNLIPCSTGKNTSNGILFCHSLQKL